MLPIITTSASPAVSSAMEEAYWPIPQKLLDWKKTGLIRAPATISRTSTGSKLTSLKRDRALLSAATGLSPSSPVGCASEVTSSSLPTPVMLSRSQPVWSYRPQCGQPTRRRAPKAGTGLPLARRPRRRAAWNCWWRRRRAHLRFSLMLFQNSRPAFQMSARLLPPRTAEEGVGTRPIAS
jgi:hypothetical protein